MHLIHSWQEFIAYDQIKPLEYIGRYRMCTGCQEWQKLVPQGAATMGWQHCGYSPFSLTNNVIRADKASGYEALTRVGLKTFKFCPRCGSILDRNVEVVEADPITGDAKVIRVKLTCSDHRIPIHWEHSWQEPA